MNIIHLDTLDVALATVLVLVNAGASWALRLRLHRQMLWAALRMVVQLLLFGVAYSLRIVTRGATLVIVMLMILVAAREATVQPTRRLARGGNTTLVVGLSSLVTVMLALLTAIRRTPCMTRAMPFR